MVRLSAIAALPVAVSDRSMWRIFGEKAKLYKIELTVAPIPLLFVAFKISSYLALISPSAISLVVWALKPEFEISSSRIAWKSARILPTALASCWSS